MFIKKARRTIAADDVPRVFDDACIRELASISKLPVNANFLSFAEGVRDAAQIYARDARLPSSNDLYHEVEELHRAADAAQIYTRDARLPNSNDLDPQVEELHRAAEGHLYTQVATLIESLSPSARALLNSRGAWSSPGIAMPSPDALHDATHREEACARIASLCRYGGHYVERRRPSGKRYHTWRWLIYAPKPRRNFPKRAPERDFVMWLSVAWADSAGKLPARTARHSALGPFARMVRECLRLVGAQGADAVELINELERRRAAMKSSKND